MENALEVILPAKPGRRLFLFLKDWVVITLLLAFSAYMNGYAAVPLISGLMEMGMIPGAAMAFITAGAVSSIPAAMAVFALVTKPVFALYIILGLTGSMLAGLFYQMSVGTL